MPIANEATEISIAVRHLGERGVVVAPTDTLYALAADVFSPEALEQVFAIKLRPPGLALPVLVGCWDQVEMVAEDLTDSARQLALRFWPGPLTLILAKLAGIPDRVTGGRDTVAVRMPDHLVPLALTSELGRPVTGTSANRSGHQDLLTLEAIDAELGAEVNYIIRSGPLPAGIPSTVVDVTSEQPRLVRHGALDFDDILAVCA